jgi:single-strand DNA-binding protein
MKDLNQCNFIGRLGQDVELKYTASGSAVANLSLACQDDYNDKASGNKIEATNWIRVVMFGKLAEITNQYAGKGSKIFVSGKQVTRTWDKNGTTMYTTEIVANEMQLLDPKGASSGSGQPQRPMQNDDGAAPVTEDDLDSIPF